MRFQDVRLNNRVTVVYETAASPVKIFAPGYIESLGDNGFSCVLVNRSFQDDRRFYVYCRYEDEGIFWCHGDNGPAVNALRAAAALSS